MLAPFFFFEKNLADIVFISNFASMKQVIKKRVVEANAIDTSEPIYTLIVDGNNLLKISLVDKRMNDVGQDYGATIQFFWQLKKMLEKKDFNFVYVMWDGDGSGQLRYNIYPDYKANRDKHYKDSEPLSDYDRQIQAYCKKVLAYSRTHRKPVKRDETEEESFNRQQMIIKAILDELFVRQMSCENVEGDDLIAYYVNHKKPEEKIVIMSGDRDLTQLIADDVCVYIPTMKKFVTPQNHVELIGYTHENVLLKKIMCGDASDNIKGIKGLGETTFFKLFPDAKSTPMTVDDIIKGASLMIEERKNNKKKPLKVTENIVGKVTDGCQGEYIYEINQRIINLKKPLLTKEAEDELSALMYAPLDPEGRDYRNIYKIVNGNHMHYLSDENKFSALFSVFERLIMNEKKFYEKNR